MQPGDCPMCPVFRWLYRTCERTVKRFACWVEDRSLGSDYIADAFDRIDPLPADWSFDPNGSTFGGT